MLYLCIMRQGQPLAHTTSLGLAKFNIKSLFHKGMTMVIPILIAM